MKENLSQVRLSCPSSLAVIGLVVPLLVTGLPARGAQSPPGCSANNLIVNIGVLANNVTNHTMVTWTVSIENPALPTSCDVTLGPQGLFFNCPDANGTPNGSKTTLIPGNVTIHPGDPAQSFEIECLVSLNSGINTAVGAVTAPDAVVHKNPLQDDPADIFKSISVNVFRPCLQVTSQCQSAVNASGSQVEVTYSVTLVNCGDVLIQNLLVNSDQPGPNTPIFGPITLPRGGSTNFVRSYTTSDNLCGPFVTTVVATGVVPLDLPVTLTGTAVSQCTIGYSPRITVTKVCPPGPVQPGELLAISGVVSNAGNIVLTNVTVVNDKPAPNTMLLGPITLPVGGVAAYSGSYLVPADSCGPYSDTVTARGNSLCGAQPVTSSATTSCPGANSPSIEVTKSCPEAPVPPGGRLTFTGTVINSGNITLNDVVVVNDKPAANTEVFRVASLAPGASASFSGSYVVPLNSCGPYTDTLRATGRDKCFGVRVTNTVTAVCPGTTAPSILVAQRCPTTRVQPGGTLDLSGGVTNTGNVTLTDILVFCDQPAPGTVVFTAATLAPGSGARFNFSYVVPPDSCPPHASTLVAQAQSICGDAVQNSATAFCPGTNSPAIRVSKSCPAEPVSPGGTLIYSGTVSNAGNITLTNVVVVNDKPEPNTVVFGPAILAPGQSATFSGSYVVPPDSCGPYSDTLIASGNDKCFGRQVTHSAAASCPGANTPAIKVTKACPPEPVPPGGRLTFTGTVTNTGNITLTDVVVVNDKPAANTEVFRLASLAPGAGASFSGSYVVPVNACGPYTDTLRATGRDKCFGVRVTNTVTAVCPGTTAPSILVAQRCPAAPVQPGSTLSLSGGVTNTGNVTLTDITVFCDQPAPGTVVFTAATLAPGVGAGFNFSYVAPPDSCGPYGDTLVAQAQSICGDPVQNSSTAFCPGTNNPVIRVSKSCPAAPVSPGETLFYSGSISNAGNITLTNVLVVNDKPALNTVVFGPAILAPGQSATFSGSYVVPPDSCGPYSDTLIASGNDKCFGRQVTHSAVAACPGTNAPAITISQNCPPEPAAIGGQLTYAGTIVNTGNITLTNVTVTSERPAPGTVVFTAVQLAPGAATNFTGSYIVPANLNACTIANALQVTGRDKCDGRAATASSTTVCPVTTAPRITITKACPALPVATGALLTYSGTVSNAGNITLSNIVVLNDRPAPNTVVFTTNALAPGAAVAFTGSYTAPLNVCSVTDTLSVSAVEKCGQRVTASATATCPLVTSPAITVSRRCPPNPVLPGQRLDFTGAVANTGNITLTNVVVTQDQPVPNTVVFGPITLAPSQSADFAGSYMVPTNVNACSVSSTLTARANDACTGNPVTASASGSCPVVTQPRILVTKRCPANPVPQGGTLVFSGTVMNTGNITLTNVSVVNSQPANNTPVFGPVTLAPGQFTNFTGSYTAPSNCCSVTDTLLARGSDICSGTVVSNTASAICPVLFTPDITLTKHCPLVGPSPGMPMTYTGSISNSGDVTLVDVVVTTAVLGVNEPVFAADALAPGESVPYTASFTVPGDFCGGDTVTVRAASLCGDMIVTDSVTSVCPVTTTPAISVTRQCPPNLIIPGQPVTFTGTVTNIGDVTLTNVTIVNSSPTPNAPVFGPITLAPGRGTNFGFTYLAPQYCYCCTLVDTFTARGQDRCAGRVVSATATTVCPLQTNPRILVSLDCPPALGLPGESLVYSGLVFNEGNITLTNVLVTANQPAANTPVFGPVTLAPGELLEYNGAFVVTANTPPLSTLVVTATGADSCRRGVVVSSSDNCKGDLPSPPTILPVRISDGAVMISWTAVAGVTYRVQTTSSLLPGTWQDVPGDVVAQSVAATKTIPMSPDQSRFYRVVVVP